MQETTFKYEVIVGEDCSPDNTREILLEYKEKHPETIHLILHEKNVGMNKNAEAVWRRCRGKYLAYCEGDDYWTDPLKLQKQADFLEKNPEYSGVSHRNLFKYPDGRVILPKDMTKVFKNGVYTIKHFEKGFLPGHTSTVMQRNFMQCDPQCVGTFFGCANAGGDMRIALWMASNGNVRYMQDTMSVYRHMSNSTSWSSSVNGKNEGFNYCQTTIKDLKRLAAVLSREDVDFKSFYVAAWLWAIVASIKRPTGENAKILRKMLRDPEIGQARYLAMVPAGLLRRAFRKIQIEAQKIFFKVKVEPPRRG
jgi:glycosyltransferase involved in cell wall biosynthesis